MKYQRFNHFFRQRFLFAFLVLVFTFVGTANFAKAQTESVLSNKDKAEVFNKVWELIDERYYDPKMNGVNWIEQKEIYKPLSEKTKTDAEFYDVIKQLVGEMNDAHTRILTPREAQEDRAKKATTTGIRLSKVEEKIVVERVISTVKGELAKIRPGMLVRTIDGLEVNRKLLEVEKTVGGSSSNRASEILAYRRILDGEPETSVKVGLTDEKGTNFEVTLIRKIVDTSSQVISKTLDSGVGYINVTSFKSPVADKFKDALIELKDTPALIIDLRYNGGGSIGEVLEMAGYLIDEKRSFGNFIRRKGKTRQSLKQFSAGEKGGQIYKQPVYVLTSKYSASGSELFSSSLQEFGRAKVIGSQTCGCLLGISRKYKLEGGGELHISDIGFLSSQGKIYEKIGVTPDKIIELKITDLQSGFDRGIDEAEKMQNSSMTDF